MITKPFNTSHWACWLLASALTIAAARGETVLGSLPETFEVHAIGISKGTQETSYVLDSTRRFATEANVVVNQPDVPVVLVLTGTQPIVWNVGRTEGTEIVGVIVSGWGGQAVVGLDESTPVAISTSASVGDFSVFAAVDQREDLLRMETQVTEILGRGITQFQNSPVGEVYQIGETVPPEMVVYSSERVIDDYLDPSRPAPALPASVFLNQMVAEGKLRLATQEDIDAWFAVASEPYQKLNPDLKVDQDVEWTLRLGVIGTYVVEDAFAFPEEGYGPFAVNFIIPEGVPLPENKVSTSWFFHMDGSRTGLFAREPAEPQDDSALDAIFSGLPPDFKLYGVEAHRTAVTLPGIRLDADGELVTQAEITVNEPDGTPVVLVLNSDEDPLVWRIGLTEGTQLAGVIVSGINEQAVIGIPETVPLKISTFVNPRGFEPMWTEGATQRLLDMNARLEAVSGKGFDFFYFEKGGASDGRFLVGSPLGAEPVVQFSDDLNLEAYRLADTPLYGRDGITQLVSEGRLRQATLEDIAVWEQEQREDLPEFASSIALQASPYLQPITTFVVLDEITYPNGLAGSNVLGFILPSGVPEPTGNPAFTKLFRVKEGIGAVSARVVVDFEQWARELEETLGEDAEPEQADRDSDRDGLTDELEFLSGSDPLDASSAHRLRAKWVRDTTGEQRATVEVPLRTNGVGRATILESSVDGRQWRSAANEFEVVEREPLNASSELLHLLSKTSLGDAPTRLFRLRAASSLD